MLDPDLVPVWTAWLAPVVSGDELVHHDGFTLRLNRGLTDERRVSVVRADGQDLVSVNAAVAEVLGLVDVPPSGVAEPLTRMAAQGMRLDGTDRFFGLTQTATDDLGRPDPLVEGVVVRLLGADDQPQFAAFMAGCSAADKASAQVELDHWLVVGAFDGGVLGAVASAYLVEHELADLGVLTGPDHRRRGLGRAVVRELSRQCLARGHQVQYRCALSNQASASLALASGLTEVGTFDCIEQD